jgi:hypothetical protein
MIQTFRDLQIWQFLGIARGSNCELQTQLEIASSLGFGKPQLLRDAQGSSQEVSKMIDSKESVKMALETLRKNKLRSGLTVLGISIGIATVILISSAINGLNTNIDTFVKSLGTNDLWCFRFEPFGKRPTTEELNRKKLTRDDGIAMRSPSPRSGRRS